VIDRAAIFRGEILTLASSAESTVLARAALARLRAIYECDDDALRAIHETLPAGALWERTTKARTVIAFDPAIRAASVALAVALGFSRAKLAHDATRLRVITPGMHRIDAARRAFYVHRDTWYGSPRAQVNAWIPLFDVDARDSFALWPSAFGVKVDNDSHTFDPARFEFQAARPSDMPYPRALATPPGEPYFVRARAGEVIAFAAAHLHGTTRNETRTTRFSIDVRFVDLDDVSRGVGAPDDDNASRGDVLDRYTREAS